MSFDVRDYFGIRVSVHHCYGAYRLPAGLPEGVEVTLEDFQPGYWTVGYNGAHYLVAMPCVGNSGRLPPSRRQQSVQRVHPGCKPRTRKEPPVGGHSRTGLS